MFLILPGICYSVNDSVIIKYSVYFLQIYSLTFDDFRWMDRKVIDVVFDPSGWIILTSCPRMGPNGSAPATYEQALSGCRVTLYHASSKRHLQLAATCGCFLPQEGKGESSQDPSVAVYVHSLKSDQEGRIFVLDLNNATPQFLSTLSPESIDLEILSNLESSTFISWLLPLESQLSPRAEDSNLSPFTVPGFSIASYFYQSERRICLLMNTGRLVIVSTSHKSILNSASMCNEGVVASTFVRDCESPSSAPLIHILTGVSGTLSVISPYLLEP
jgi:hypothetical protein